MFSQIYMNGRTAETGAGRRGMGAGNREVEAGIRCVRWGKGMEDGKQWREESGSLGRKLTLFQARRHGDFVGGWGQKFILVSTSIKIHNGCRAISNTI